MNLHLSLRTKVCIGILVLFCTNVRAQDMLDDEANAALEAEIEAVELAPVEELLNSESQAQQIELEDEPLSNELEPSREVLISEEENNFPASDSVEGLVAVPYGGLVEYEDPSDYNRPYSERRRTHGAYFGLSYEPVFFSNFNSPVGGATYKEVYGESVLPLIGLSGDYKFNTGLGALSLGLFYSMGSVTGSIEAVDHTLSLTRAGFSARFALDQVTAEPYFVPYVGLVGFQDQLKDETTTESKSNSYPLAFTWIAGAMIQLDWIDKSSAIESRKVGIENAFLDVFVTQYASVSDQSLADTKTDMLVGGGLRLEF